MESSAEDSGGFEEFLTSSLAEIDRQGLRRSLVALESPQLPRVLRNGRTLVNFSSNDYLGLAAHPALKAAAEAEWARGGFGAGASRLICGTMTAHEMLEQVLADFKRTEAALSFSSGYAAAMGTIPAICGSGDVIILDKLSHACLVDASRLSGATLRVFPHNDLNKLESHLQWATRTHPKARILVVAESIYSMDGDLAPLRELVGLKDRYGAWLFLDEAHAVGVLGPNGGGLAEQLNLGERIEIQMGTLGKALGSHGAYIAGSTALREFLINRARSFIFSTSPPPPVAAASAKAVEIVRSNEGVALREALWKNIRSLEGVLGIPKSSSAIVPLIIGEESQAMKTAQSLRESGFLVPAIRFPTVAKGSARLRITVTAAHQSSDIEALGATLNAF